MKEKKSEIFWIGDRYCGLYKIGSGGMGEVWAGKSIGDRGFERIVAIKRLHYERKRRESHHRAILDEATVLQHISASPNIVSIIDLREEDGQPALIMEYVDGPELRDVLQMLSYKKADLPFPLTAYIVTEISKGLSNAHRCKHPKTGEPLNIVHRDVSPSNILLSSAGAVKLTDFGIAKSEVQTTKTRVGEIKGKYQYMPPEQARGKKIDYRTDYFALGLILYECLFGRPAYEAETDAEFIEKARDGKITYPKGISRGLKKIFEGLLSYDPDRRYSDLEQFRRDMGQLAIDSGGIATSDDLSNYLKDLNIPQLNEAIERRINLEKMHEVPCREEEAVTGISIQYGWIRNRKVLIGAVAALIVLGAAAGYIFLKSDRKAGPPLPSTAVTAPITETTAAKRDSGSLTIETSPRDASILLRYKDRKIESPSPAVFSDVPLDTTLKISARKSDYFDEDEEITLTADNPSVTRTIELRKKPLVKVRFTATPPSSVTVPGRITNQDAPSPMMSLPAGSYSVIFKNPLAVGEARATLDAQSGGSFICSADMEIDARTGAPNGEKPKAHCRKTY